MKWNSVKKGLPDDNPVLVLTEDNDIYLAKHRGINDWKIICNECETQYDNNDISNFITHWAALPDIEFKEIEVGPSGHKEPTNKLKSDKNKKKQNNFNFWA